MRRHSGKRRASGWVWFAGGLAAGAALGWLTAPRRGDWVRNQARQKLASWCRTSTHRMRKRGRDLENRVQGTVAEIREMWSGRGHYVDANTLVDQVRTALGRSFAAALEHVNLNAVSHTLYLHGYVQEVDERKRLIAAVRAVDGVEDVQAAGLRLQPPCAGAPAPMIIPKADVRESSAPAPLARSIRHGSPAP